MAWVTEQLCQRMRAVFCLSCKYRFFMDGHKLPNYFDFFHKSHVLSFSFAFHFCLANLFNCVLMEKNSTELFLREFHNSAVDIRS